MIIDSAETFYAAIKGNPMMKEMEDREAIDALEEYFRARMKAADADIRLGIVRDRYMFFQGMLAGARVMAKIFKHHITAEAYNQNVDPLTGKRDDANQKDS